jgi:hypothetical protein
MKIKSIFRHFRGNVDEKKKWDLLLDQYIKSFERFEEKCFFEKIDLLHSSYLKKMYIHQNLIKVIVEINNFEEKEKDKEKRILLHYIQSKFLSYDDFETIFIQFFKINDDDKDKIRVFVKPFYKDGIKDKKVLKCIMSIFLFFVSYFQFYMILHEFLEIESNDLQKYLYLFVHSEEEEKKKSVHNTISYYSFQIYIKKVFTLFYQTIHYIQDITEIKYTFDIHNITKLKEVFYKMILIKKEETKRKKEETKRKKEEREEREV